MAFERSIGKELFEQENNENGDNVAADPGAMDVEAAQLIGLQGSPEKKRRRED